MSEGQSTLWLYTPKASGKAQLLVKENGILAGMEVARLSLKWSIQKFNFSYCKMVKV